MEWMKNIVGDELYGELDTNGSLAKLKEKFGDSNYIAHDKDKWIEKHVFNNQREEVKSLKTKIEEYEKQLTNTKDLITSDEHKRLLGESETAFKKKLEELEKNYTLNLEKKSKENMLLSSLSTSGCRHPKLLLNNIDLDNVILKDDSIVNSKELINGLKNSYPELFSPNLNSNVPKGGTGGSKSTKDQLIEQYNKMSPGANKMALMKKIKELENNN